MSREIDHRHVRSAVEFAVLIAAEGQKRRPPLAYPKELKPFLSAQRVPSSALGRLRRAIESDATFRAAIAAGALPELVDEVGRLWLDGRPGWEERAAELIDAAAADADSNDLQRDLRRAEKRRLAAEQATARVQVEVLTLTSELEAERRLADLIRADLDKADDAVAELRAELIDTRNEARHARDREAAAVRRAEAAEAALELATAPSEPVAHDALAEPSTSGAPGGPSSGSRGEAGAAQVSVDDATLSMIVAAANDLADQVAALRTGRDRSQRGASDRVVRREPMALPRGIIATSSEAAAYLVRADATLLIDGYNVAKLAWPERSLAQQRDALIARVENLARRHDGDVTIVFDGAAVVGAYAGGPRRSVRTVFSPEGVTADDVIRAEVRRLPHDRAVIVVTNDREIVRDVRAQGANVIPSNAFIAVL
jgi:predicted RNA-binding protein with PIN domain